MEERMQEGGVTMLNNCGCGEIRRNPTTLRLTQLAPCSSGNALRYMDAKEARTFFAIFDVDQFLDSTAFLSYLRPLPA